MIKIESLTEKTLREAIDLVDTVFPVQGEEPARIVFPASLNLEKYKDFLLEVQIPELRYWLAIDDSGKVAGTTGLYCYEFDKEEACWLGWFCVDPNTRKKGTGTQLLQFSIREAKKQGKRFLRLYTSTDPNESNAHRLYEKHGFVKLSKEERWFNTEFKMLFYELKL